MTRKNYLYFILCGFFLTNALVAEIIGGKIFSLEKTFGFKPIIISLFGNSGSFNLTAGVILWPVVFIITDLINEYFGEKGVKRLSYFTVILLIYTFVMLQFAMFLKPSDWWLTSQLTSAGIQSMDKAFNVVLSQGLFIILGSLIAFLIGQIVDAFIFTKIKERTGGNMIWLRATGSTLVSQFIDSFVVLFIAFYIGGSMQISQVMQICITNYIYKFVVAILLTPVLYFVHNVIDTYLAGEKDKNNIVEI